MSEFDRRLKVKPRATSGQCSIENAGSIPCEIWDAEYVNLSGFCGPHSPHVFAAAPVMLDALREAEFELSQVDWRFAGVNLKATLTQIRAAIAAAGGGAG